jgi:riboflavin synthase
MFTGIIEALADVLDRTPMGLRIARPGSFTDVKLGASIAVSGVCLTVTAFDDAGMSFDVVDETWDRTTLGALQAGDKVNLERALAANGRLDGHVVQGHIEGVGEFIDLNARHEARVKLPKELLPFAIPKGSICLDGVSLTIAAVKDDVITVALIPETLSRTTFGLRKKGDGINIETDILIRAVLHSRTHAD